MLTFTDLTLEDKEWIQPLLDASGYRSTEYSFTFTYLWRNVFKYQVARMNDYFLLKSKREDYPCTYLFPAGSGDIKPVIEALIEDACPCGEGLTFHTILEEGKKVLEESFPDQFEYMELNAYYDYVYESEKIISLAGKKLANKRNHINRFQENFPDWVFEEITQANREEVLEMNREWTDLHTDDFSPSFEQEAASVEEAIRAFDKTGMDGGLIRTHPEGKVVAFSMGDRVTKDTYLVSIEKAYSDIQGAYAIINREFAKRFCGEYQYINREDASGIPGLVKAKESYRPAFLLEKYAGKQKR